MICPIIKEIYNNFTYELIIKPVEKHEIDEESSIGTTGISGKRYALGPGGTSDPERAGIGVSIGTNGISVYEHSVNHLPAVLVHQALITDEMHIAIVYEQKTPYLFVNGMLIKKGQTSSKQFVHPSIIIGGLHPYGFYRGEIKDIRIWNFAKTGEQLRANASQQLTGKEKGLYFHYHRPSEPLTIQSKLKNIEVSVIIPSYNKYPENLFTLHSLANQTYNLSKVEVIFIDDGSTDATFHRINPTSYPFLMKCIHLTQNRGRPHSRNIALKHAAGKVIIFLDAETIVAKDFIQKHIKAHHQASNLVVSAVMNQKGVYTVYNPSFTTEQQNQCFQLMKKANYSDEEMKRIKASTEKTPLISFKDIELETYKKLAFEKPHESFYKKQVLTPFGHLFANFHMPWLSFYTGNVSVQRHLLQKAGFFEENKFKGYGWEDTEMGYRLYRAGAAFMHHGQIITYHQEHPIHPSIPLEAKKNSYIFFDMYQSDFAVLILILYVAGQEANFMKLNAIVSQYKLLEKQHPHTYKTFKYGIRKLLLALGYANAFDLPIQNLLEASNVTNDRSRFKQFQKEVNLLKRTKKYPLLIDICEHLMKL